MFKVDEKILKHNKIIIIIAIVIYNMSLEHLLDNNYPASIVLFYRGFLGFTMISFIAAYNKESILPKNISLQIFRLTISGLALFLAFIAYKKLAASTISMIARLDIPLVILTGIITAKKISKYKLTISTLSIVIVISMIFYSNKIDEDPLGIIYALLAVTLISITYLIVKKSTLHENNLSIVNTTNIGCLVFGLIISLTNNESYTFKLVDVWILFLAVLSQFILNYSMAVVYRTREVEKAQRPYLLGAVAVLISEQLIEHKLFSLLHICTIIIVLTLIYSLTIDEYSLKRQFIVMKKIIFN